MGECNHGHRMSMAFDMQTREPGTKDESSSVDDIDDASETKKVEISLQEAFLQFRKKKQVREFFCKFQEVPIISLLTLASL